ncbi:NlpC/P60 family protein [Streptomyces mirabilis]|uniref:C40 family peptidase n=1 Tax=Streptomyces mirabilis TaxID=68239 RepID=UPI0021C0AF71|nr:NlpC/P60 family protein [Streptomyces mirabilis]MCT9107414.1 NlpC/P60 family protein [Streptomyces mirabilis]
MPDSARATAALSGADGPSREEVQQRISSLYDQAENAAGFVNGTRAMTTGSRNRVNPAPETARRRRDPALDDITKTWFDAARRQLGPSAPARLPADRMPKPPAGARPTGPAKRPEDGLGDRGRELTARPVLELTAGPSAEAAAGPVAELTARAVAALPAAPELAPQPAQEAATALLPALPAGPAQSSLKTSKEKIQRKLALARELVSKHAAQWNPGPAAIESRPAEGVWPTPEDQARQQAAQEWQRQQSTALGPDMSMGTGMPLGADMSMSMGMPLGADMSLGAGMPLATDMSMGVGMPLGADMPFGAGMPLATGMPLGADMSLGAGMPLATDMSMGVGMPLATGMPVGTGAVNTAVGAVGAAESAYGGKAAKALAFAREQIGKPCVWGATGPDSYDSASLVQAAWRAAGVALPRTVHGQATAGAAIPLTDIQFGDLIFFYDNVSHVGFYTGNGMMIHAPSPGASIREESLFFAGQNAIHGALRPA